MLVAQQRAVTLQGFTQDGIDACNLMDYKQQNSPQLLWHASWILLLEVRDDSEPTHQLSNSANYAVSFVSVRSFMDDLGLFVKDCIAAIKKKEF